MILSFHPCFEGDRDILCAGREPDDSDLSAVQSADAVILPQGCRQSLYEMAVGNASHVFPNYNVRFQYPGKIGQSQLFNKLGLPHPVTEIYETVPTFKKRNTRLAFPFVFKFNWGGEGDNVSLIRSASELDAALFKAERFERTGQSGFILQEYIPSNGKSLRAVVVGEYIRMYWRVQHDSQIFVNNVSKGGEIDHEVDSVLRDEAEELTRKLCRLTGINLAGLDFLLPSEKEEKTSLMFLEINYFFGRHGLGGSEAYYKLLNREIRQWLNRLKDNI